MTHFAWRHFCSRWRLNAAVMLCLALMSAALLSPVGYAAGIATQGLAEDLRQAGAARRTLLVTGTARSFGEELDRLLKDRLGWAIEERVVICRAELLADPPTGAPNTTRRPPGVLAVYSFDPLVENVRVVAGRLPDPIDMAGVYGWPPPVEAVIGSRAAEQLGYGVGDRLTATGFYQRLDIVGIVEPLAPSDDAWGEDMAAFAAVVTPTQGLAPEATTLALIVAQGSMRAYLPGAPLFPHDTSWRIGFGSDAIGIERAGRLRLGLTNFQAQATTAGASATSGLEPILSDALERWSRLRTALHLLTAQVFLCVLCSLLGLGSCLADRSLPEMAGLSERGASTWQIAWTVALQKAWLALPAALLLGPAVALGAIALSSGGVAGMPASLSREAWLMAWAAAALAWLALALPAVAAARRRATGHHTGRARPPQRSALHRRYLDLYLLAFSALLCWQLTRSGSFLMTRLGGTQWADPLLLLGPPLLALAAAAALLRVLPLLVRPAAWALWSLRGAVLPLGLARAARDPLPPARTVLLVALTASAVLFARALESALEQSGAAVAYDGVLVLGARALALFGGFLFCLVHLLAVRERAREYGVLRALGVSVRQWLGWAIVEGVQALLLGLLAGAVVGVGLSCLIVPYLLQALAGCPAAGDPSAALPPPSAIGHLLPAHWLASIRSCLWLACAYGAALAIVWAVLYRSHAQRVPWLEGE